MHNFTALARVEAYDLRTGDSAPLASTNIAPCDYTAAELNGRIYAIEGSISGAR